MLPLCLYPFHFLKVLGDAKILGSFSNDFKTGTSDPEVMATEPRKRPKSPLSNRREEWLARTIPPPPCQGNRLAMTNGEVCPACGFIGLVYEAGPEVAHLAGTSPLHAAYPLLYPALPGGRYRGRG